MKDATCSCVKCFRHAPLLPCRMWFFFTRPPAAIFAASTNAAVAFMLEKEAPPQTASMVASVASIPQNDATCLTFTGEAMRGGVQCNATKTTHSARRLQSRQHYLFAGAQRFLFPFFLFCFFFFFFSSFSSLFSPPHPHPTSPQLPYGALHADVGVRTRPWRSAFKSSYATQMMRSLCFLCASHHDACHAQ